jgi:DNA-binding CsgD family transcriptional regulator
MVTKGPEERLLGRRVECGVLERLLVAAREARGGALVLYGQSGVGKTALLDVAIASADGFRVACAVGVESEMELPFSALQQLCGPMLDRLDGLPSHQRTGLRVAFGLTEGEQPDRFLVGLAVLSLLSEVAARQPLLCVVDDAQWLDRASALALAFVARRLLAEPIALVFAAREPGEELRGLSGLVVEGLGEADARVLLGAAVRTRLDEQVVERILAETHGNPLALLELPRGLTPAQLAGGFGLPAALPLAGRIEESFRRRLATLPSDTRRLLLVAAAEPVGDTALVWRAAARLGVDNSAAEAAESEGLLDLGAGMSFRHPLVRSAAYRAASPRERREAHDALAEATDPGTDPDRRAWHHAQATTGPDEDVAAELERSADRAHARGGFAAAAAFLERSTALTPEPGRRASRALAGAQAKHQAGALDAALRLIAIAESGPLDEFQRARVDVVRAQISFASNRGSDAPSLLLKAAERLKPLDAGLAREIYLDALSAALFAGRFASGGSVVDAAKAARSASPSPRPPSAWDLLLDGLTVLITAGPSVGVPTLKRALSVLRDEPVGAVEGLRWLWLAGRAAGFIWDYDTWDALTSRQIELARDAGALAVLPMTLSTRSVLHLFAGELPIAASLVEEANAIIDATDSRTVPYAPLTLAAFRGREAEASRLIQARTKDFIARGEGMGLTHAQWATAALYNGLARYEHALAAAEQAYEDPRELWFSTWATVELIEAASRSGKRERAANALDVLAETTRAGGTDWGLAVEARSRALLSPDDRAEALYREAIERLQHTRLRVDLARAHLVYGEWLRRERRRLDARDQLRVASDLFTDFGMEAFAERARIELRATGERARKRNVETRDDLTAQEALISRLAAQGATNQEIAAQLFISPSTVEYHLRKTFRKLDVKSRTQLAHRLHQQDVRGEAAIRQS